MWDNVEGDGPALVVFSSILLDLVYATHVCAAHILL